MKTKLEQLEALVLEASNSKEASIEVSKENRILELALLGLGTLEASTAHYDEASGIKNRIIDNKKIINKYEFGCYDIRIRDLKSQIK